MSINSRGSFKLPSSGPYVARITNHLDPTQGGGVEATMQLGTFDNPELQSHVYILQYLSPFYGVTSSKFEGNDNTNVYDVQKSYGMWMVPPDVGTKVLCIFVDGDSNQGYWIGCIQDRFQNHMVPGLAASTNVAWGPGQKEKFGVQAVPVAEYLKKNNDTNSPNTEPKPVHPFADRLLTQGLLADTIRGITSSSARREVPSAVFGISTPGPTDDASKPGKIGYTDAVTGEYDIKTSRLAGHTFVMDDGDVDGYNQLVRIRSSSGHQILLHDSAGIIYIANSNGTAWMEFTANGKIDIYAADSVSIHTEQDFNFRADRDVNIEALGSLNFKSGNHTVFNAGTDFNVAATTEIKLKTDTNFEVFTKTDIKLTTANNFELLVQKNGNITAAKSLNLISTEINASKIKTPKGSPQATPATEAINNVITLPTFEVPSSNTSGGWASRYQTGTVTASMERVPMHEPWIKHDTYTPGESYIPPTIVTPTVLTYSADTWFDPGKDKLTAFAEKNLTALAEKITAQKKTNPATGTVTSPNKIIITGHTDDSGTDAFDISLSQRRADAAKQYLVDKGVGAETIIATGKGKSAPVAPNTTPAGKAQNRRVEVKVTGPFVDPSSSNADLTFTARTGDEKHFEMMTDQMKNAVRAAAKAYATRFPGKKITINSAFRTEAEETALYNRWIAAGGNYTTNKTAGGLTTPINPATGRKSPHSRGIAVDCQEAVQLDSLGFLAPYGLKRPYAWDPLHIQLQ